MPRRVPVPPALVEEAGQSLDGFIASGVQSFVDASREFEARPSSQELQDTCLDLIGALDAMLRLRQNLRLSPRRRAAGR